VQLRRVSLVTINLDPLPVLIVGVVDNLFCMRLTPCPLRECHHARILRPGFYGAGLSAASGLVRINIINGFGAGADGGGGNPSLSPAMATGAFPSLTGDHSTSGDLRGPQGTTALQLSSSSALRVPELVVHPLAVMIPTRKPMYVPGGRPPFCRALRSLVVRDTGLLEPAKLARRVMPAHKHCQLFLPAGGRPL